MLIRKLFRTLWRYKAQFISMVLMIAMGVGVFLGFNIEWYSLEKNLTEIYEATGYSDYRVYAEKAFSEEDGYYWTQIDDGCWIASHLLQ